MNNQEYKPRILYIDILNIAAAFAVVWLHFNNEIHWYAPTCAWVQAAFVQALAYWAVPVFFMITGAMLMDYRKKYNTIIFLKKRVLRIVVPYLFWGAIFMLWRISRGELPALPNNILQKQWSILDIFINNKMEPVYWFFAPYISIVFSLPVLGYFTEEAGQKTLKYILWLGIFTITVIPFTYNFLNTVLQYNTGWWNSSWQPAILGGYIIFPVTGYYLHHHDFSKGKRYFIYLLGISMCLFRLWGILYLCTRDNAKNMIFFDYLIFPSYCWAVSVYLLFKNIKWEKIFKAQSSKKILSEISNCSYGVYLIHILVLTKMQDFSYFKGGQHNTIWHFLAPIFCYLFCVVIVWIGKKVPIIKMIFP